MKSYLSLAVAFAAVSAALADEDKSRDTSFAGNKKVAEIIQSFAGRGVQSDGSSPTEPAIAQQQFRMRDGLEIDLVAAEPEVSQPLFLSWDSRGRMWVVQYRQYQYPAGLKVVRYDQHLRAVFDKVPEPPPRGPVGKDRITVFEDTDGDGKYDTSKDVITGLNIATSVQVGHGGIWVLNPPYLLFYPDANHDDEPDGDPEVCLSGFGLEDTHSVSNSLLWGPDGWLYAVNGSTTVCTINSAVTKGVHFKGQCVWRYHPDTKVFEVYAEGGGNTFSLDIDSKGRVFTGTNGGGTRGFYFPQGSYSHKNWGKHGPLTNPYAFGFFRQMESKGDNRRFPQAFLVYEGGLFPNEFDGSVIAPNAMHNLIWHSHRIEKGSTYRTQDDANLAETSDRWFRPVYAGVGADGAIYVADWYDTRLSHVSPVDDWHKESGRIYRIYPNGLSPKNDVGDLSQMTSQQLVDCFVHSNKWVRQRAALEIGWKGDKSIVPTLVANVNMTASLESLWALNILGEFTTERAAQWLQHSDPHIRRWVIRLLGDRREGLEGFVSAARNESNPQVRSQFAATAKRLSSEFALPTIRAILDSSDENEDSSDPHMPLMIWWAIEAQCHDSEAIYQLFADPSIWEIPLVESVIAERIMQRYASAGSAKDLQQCSRMIALAPNDTIRDRLVAGLNRAFQGRVMPPLPKQLEDALNEYQAARGHAGIVLALRQQKAGVNDEAISAVEDRKVDLGIRIELARTFGEVKVPQAVRPLLRIATARDNNEIALQRVAIQSLVRYDDPSIANTLVGALGNQISEEHDLRSTACRTLASRTTWANRLLQELIEWRLKVTDIPPDVVQRLRTYKDPQVVMKVNEVFGEPISSSAPETTEEIKRLIVMLSDATNVSMSDHAKGKQHFKSKCATCHQLFGEGDKIGPPLDAYDRGNLRFWVPAIVAPSLEIREGYQSYSAVTNDGRVVTGMIAAQDPKTVTLRTAENQSIVLDRKNIESLQAIKMSLMPSDILRDMTDHQVRDLLAYLMLGTSP